MAVKNKKRVVLLDAHAILHRAYHALPEFVSSKGEPTGALYGVSAMVLKIIQSLKPDYIFACFDLPKPTYRHLAYAEYKTGRKETEEQLVVQIKRSRDIFKAFSIQIFEKEGFEADDILGTIVEKLKSEPDVETIIASGDMDTLQLISKKKVKVYTLKKGLNDTIMYDEDAVHERFGFGPELIPDYKGLRGDPSDNIPGIHGIGEKTASTLIQEFGNIENIYKQLKKDESVFEKKGIKARIIGLLKEGEEEAVFSKMLATIRRDATIDFSLPEKSWRDEFNSKNVLDIFGELGFRNLSMRARTLWEEDKPQLFGSDTKENKIEDVEDLFVALWLIKSNITNPTIEDVFQYTKTDTVESARKKLMEEINAKKLSEVFNNIEKPLISIIKKMNSRGIKVDTKYLTKLSVEYHKKLSALEKNIWDIAGREFNINSPKQMGEVLYDELKLSPPRIKKTASGARSTRESELEKMRDSHPIIGSILEYREFQKLLSTYIDNIPELLGDDGRLRATFVQAGTTTGRMASQKPNLQNIPIRTEFGRNIRNAFLATKGFSLLGLDYSQIELRVAAFMSGDPKLVDIFKRGVDVHTAVASQVFRVSENDVDSEMRRRAKVINFGILYGMGVNALRANLGTSREEAQMFSDAYFAQFSGLAEYMEQVKKDAYKNGYTETFFGRRRYFEGLKSRLPYVRAQSERMAINAPIQGTAADLIKIAMKEIDAYFVEEKLETDAFLLLQVHDELVYEISEAKLKDVSLRVKDIMESVLSVNETKGVPLIANVEFGPNWGEMKDATHNLWK